MKKENPNFIPTPQVDKTGEHYGHWIVKKQDIEKSKETGRIYWLCECDCGCGTQKSIRVDALYQVTIGGCSNVNNLKGKVCEKCGKIFYPQKHAETRRFCYECIPEQMQPGGSFYRKIIKRWGLEYKNNQCELCGYNKCKEALEFHHINPNEKDFILSEYTKLDWIKIKAELDKCILVCSNCHREIHAGLRDMTGKEVSNENVN